MNRPCPKIYCAGPLFNPIEQIEMANIASALEESGYKVFLPQRDGLELLNTKEKNQPLFVRQ